MKNKILSFFETYYPVGMGAICCIISIFIFKKVNVNLDVDEFDKVLDSVINFTSIVIGFIGVLIGILFSIRNSVLVDKLFKHKSREKLKKYFVESFISGVLLIVLSIIMYLRKNLIIGECDLSVKLFNLWVGFIAYTLLCSYRIISIMILIVFHEDEIKSKQEELPEERKTDLDRKYSRQIHK